MNKKVIIGEWHEEKMQCSECPCKSPDCYTVVRPTFVRFMCPSCFESFIDLERIMMSFDSETLNDWYQTQAII